MRKTSKGRGFTLPEVLVTVTIVAVLAAVMVPAVINQVSKGDVPAVGQDLSAIRTGLTTFAADLRRFPGKLSQMATDSLYGAQTDIVGAAFAGDTVNYHGPYLSVGAHTGPTGAVFADLLFVPVGTQSICLKDSVNVTSKVTVSQAVQMDKALDNNDGAATGGVQWALTGSNVTPGSFRACLTTK